MTTCMWPWTVERLRPRVQSVFLAASTSVGAHHIVLYTAGFSEGVMSPYFLLISTPTFAVIPQGFPAPAVNLHIDEVIAALRTLTDTATTWSAPAP